MNAEEWVLFIRRQMDLGKVFICDVREGQSLPVFQANIVVASTCSTGMIVESFARACMMKGSVVFVPREILDVLVEEFDSCGIVIYGRNRES